MDSIELFVLLRLKITAFSYLIELWKQFLYHNVQQNIGQLEHNKNQ
jgi:hypothetical protein